LLLEADDSVFKIVGGAKAKIFCGPSYIEPSGVAESVKAGATLISLPGTTARTIPAMPEYV
jgi:hypothetical protein